LLLKLPVFKIPSAFVIAHRNQGKFRSIPRKDSGEVLAQAAREAVDAPSLEVFKARVDGALGSLV